jgi:CheY-like chemotaxis protein
MTQNLPPKSLVLYVDDDADDRELVREIFDEFAAIIELTLFEDGHELIDYLENLAPLQPRPCLIIVDINMPRMDGKKTLRAVRNMQEFEEVPVVLFSTSTLPSDAAFAHNYKAGFITKPLHGNQVHLIAEQLIEHCTNEVKERIRKYRGR